MSCENDNNNIDYQHRSHGETNNFRSSPNLKFIKKYRMIKIQEAAHNNSNTSAAEQVSCPSPEEENSSSPPTVMVQPPLPPYPPPPDRPQPITLKKEIIEEDEYQSNNEELQNKFNDIVSECAPSTSEGTLNTTKRMCRQFVRGVCTRGNSCIFWHEIIPDQLPGVYTFCKNFQNNGCIYPRCKFVHATVFEKEHFYRTGYLPPHATEHLKENYGLPPPQPPPTQGTRVPVAVQTVFNAPPPPPPPPLNAFVGAGTSTMGAGASLNSSRKREWADFNFNATSSTSPGHDFCDVPFKRCHKCDYTALKYEYNKNKLEEQLRIKRENEAKMAIITSKNKQIFSLITSLIISQCKQDQREQYLNNINIKNEKEKLIMEKLNLLYASQSNTRVREDTSVNMAMLMSLLLNSGENGSLF